MEHKKECYIGSRREPMATPINAFLSELESGSIDASKSFDYLYNNVFADLVTIHCGITLESLERRMLKLEKYSLKDYVEAHYTSLLIDNNELLIRTQLTPKELDDLAMRSFGKKTACVKNESDRKQYKCFKAKHGLATMHIPGALIVVNSAFSLLGMNLFLMLLIELLALTLGYLISVIYSKIGLIKPKRDQTDSDTLIDLMFTTLPLFVCFLGILLYRIFLCLIAVMAISFVFWGHHEFKTIMRECVIFVSRVVKSFFLKRKMSYTEHIAGAWILAITGNLFVFFREAGDILFSPFAYPLCCSGDFIFAVIGAILYELACISWVITALKFDKRKTAVQSIKDVFNI